MSAVRSYTDEHIALAVVAGLRRRGVDVSTTQEAGMLGQSESFMAFLAEPSRETGGITLEDFARRLAETARTTSFTLPRSWATICAYRGRTL